MRLDSLVGFLDDYLRVTEEIADAPEALSGLQVANSGEVTRLAAAVDLCEATIRMADQERADCLLVHHGLFWGGLRPLVGPAYRRVAGLIARNIALYAAHLPLDRHPDVGNNARLAQLLGVAPRGEFGSYRGAPIGVWGELNASRDDLSRTLATTLGAAPRVLPFGPSQVRRVGIVTGEGQHWTFFDAEELGVNVFYAGHYATETVGVKALAEHVSRKYSIPWVFLDHPTGL